MNKLDKFRFGSYHKRRLIGLLIIVASVFAVALALLAVLGIFSYRAELVTIRLSSNTNGSFNDGVGININEIPSSNRLDFSGFQRENSYRSFTVADCSGDYIFLDANSGLSANDFEIGSEIRVLSLDNDGVMSLRYSGLVNSFDNARFGLNIPIEDADGNWINDPVVDIASVSDNLVALTSSGKLVCDITSDDFVKVYSDENKPELAFTAMCSYSDYIYALSNDNNVYVSTDGRNFVLLFDANSCGSSIRTFAGVDSSVAFLTEDNKYWISSGSEILQLSVPFDIDENTVIVSSNGCLLVITSAGDVYSTSNGLVFERILDEANLFISGDNYIDYKSVGNKFYFLTDYGRLVVFNYDTINQSYSFDLSEVNPIMIEVTSSESVIVVTSDKKACLVSEEGSISDLSNNTGNVDAVYCASGDRLIMRSGNNLYFVTVLGAIQVNSDIPDDSVVTGDLCYIKTLSASAFSEDNWFVATENTSVSYYNNFDSVVTNSSVRVFGLGNGTHAISFPLYGDATDNFSYNTFYRISLKLRSDSNVISNVKVWIYGEQFGEEGFTIDEVTTNSGDYSYVFALTGSKSIAEDDQLYFNISYEGEGILFVDDAYLGEDRYSINTIPYDYANEIINSHPSAIRLNNINFLSNSNSDEILYGLGTNSIETSLSLVKQAQSNPWFVVGSYADSQSVKNFVEYLCGSVSSDYGKHRIDNGTAIPWSRQFDTIYIEISDTDNVYLTDMQRGAYVSYVKLLFAQSEFYSEIKDRVVFLDGMEYEGGVVTSSADFHTMSASMESSDYSNLKLYFDELNYEVPRMALGGLDVGEYISNLSIDYDGITPATGVFAAPMISNYSSFVRMSLVNVEISEKPIDTENISIFADSNVLNVLKTINCLSVLDDSYRMFYDVINPLDTSSGQSAAQFTNDCAITLIEKDGINYLIVANASNEQQQFTVEGIGNDAHMLRYSAEGVCITDRNYRRSDVRITLQAGEMIIISYSGK